MTDLSINSGELVTSSGKASLISSRSSSTTGVGAGGEGSLSISVKARACSPPSAYPTTNSHPVGGGAGCEPPGPGSSSLAAHTSSSNISHSSGSGSSGSHLHHHPHQHHHQHQQQHPHHQHHLHHHPQQHPPPPPPQHHQQQPHHPHQGQAPGGSATPLHPQNLSHQPSSSSGASMEVFNLRWDEYHRIVIDSFWSLFTEESLVDCTLVCSPTETVKVHRIVLSANSPYFRSLLASHTAHPHPIIILHDVRYSILKMLITFMYRGEVNVLPEEMTSLLKTAESLQILGLCSSQNSHTVTTTTMTSGTVMKRKASCSARSSGASSPFEVGGVGVLNMQHRAPTPLLTPNATISNSNASSPPPPRVEPVGVERRDSGGGVGNVVGNTPNNTAAIQQQQAVYSKKARILEQQHHHHFSAHHHHHHHGHNHGPSGGPGGTYNSSSSSSPGTPVPSGTPIGPGWMMDQPLALKKEDSRSISPSTPSPPPDSPPPIRMGGRESNSRDSYHNIRMSRTSSPVELLRRSTSSSPKPGWAGGPGMHPERGVPLSPPPTSHPPAHSQVYQHHHNAQPHHHHPPHHHHHQQHAHNLRKLSGQSALSRGAGPLDDPFVDEDVEFEDLSRGGRGMRERERGDPREVIMNDADMNPSDEEEDEDDGVRQPQSRNSLDLASSSRSSSTSGINLIQGASHMDQDPAVLCLRYCCPYCSTNFPSQSTLSRHIMILHPTVYQALYTNAAPPGGGGPVPPDRSTSPLIETAHNLVKLSSQSNCNDRDRDREGHPLENHHLPPGHPGGGPSSGMMSGDPQGGGGGSSSSSSTSGGQQQSSIVCKFCGKPFPEVSQLIQHLPIHTGERPFKCEFCGKAFKLRHHMKDHARVHTGERPFRCGLCGKTFSRSTILKAHEKTHFPKGTPGNNGNPAEGNTNSNSGESSGKGGGGAGFKL